MFDSWEEYLPYIIAGVVVVLVLLGLFAYVFSRSSPPPNPAPPGNPVQDISGNYPLDGEDEQPNLPPPLQPIPAELPPPHGIPVANLPVESLRSSPMFPRCAPVTSDGRIPSAALRSEIYAPVANLPWGINQPSHTLPVQGVPLPKLNKTEAHNSRSELYSLSSDFSCEPSSGSNCDPTFRNYSIID